MKSVAIIGGGYTGLSCAKKLVDNGFDVTIYEKKNELGGMACCIDFQGTKIEKHYRHIFRSDEYAVNLIEELGLSDKLRWNETAMAYYSKSGLYKFGTPISLMKYKPLTLPEKIRFGNSIVKLKLINDYKKVENITAEEWIKDQCGESVYKKIWEPLLLTKFGNEKDKVSMAWLWGKIKLRGSSSTSRGEKLGYLDGSFDILTQKLTEYLKSKKCKFNLNTSVEGVVKRDNQFDVITDGNKSEYDFVVSTVSYDVAKKIFEKELTEKEFGKMNAEKYTCARTMLICSKKQFTPYYWINIGDTDIPFGGIIEHTNMIEKGKYNGNHIIYISNYMNKDDKLYKMNKDELLDIYLKHMKKINSDIDKEDIISVSCYEEDDAQPIICTNYSENLLNIELESSGIFMGNMAQIYPEDRGMNYAIRMGYDIAKRISDLA